MEDGMVEEHLLGNLHTIAMERMESLTQQAVAVQLTSAL